MTQKAKELKSQYGVVAKKKAQDGDDLARLIRWFISRVPMKLNPDERQEITALIETLEERLLLSTG